jgi:hypothetical protein
MINYKDMLTTMRRKLMDCLFPGQEALAQHQGKISRDPCVDFLHTVPGIFAKAYMSVGQWDEIPNDSVMSVVMCQYKDVFTKLDKQCVTDFFDELRTV